MERYMPNGIFYYRELISRRGKGGKCTQKDVADYVGIPRSRLSFIESGEALPTPDEVELIAEYLEVTPGHLFTTKQMAAISEIAWIKDKAPRVTDGKKTERKRIDARISSGMTRAIHNNKAGFKWEKWVGYTYYQLVEHLEKQFDRDMTWDNYGWRGWHIDHIVPRSSFNYDTTDSPEFKKCWALSNLQPMWHDQHAVKGRKVSEEWDNTDQ
jgi:transcriptional regulator with XRE-family HTH domain